MAGHTASLASHCKMKWYSVGFTVSTEHNELQMSISLDPFFVWLAVQYLVAQPLDNLDRDPRKVLNVIKLQKTKASVFDTYTHQPACQGLSIDKEKPFE